MKKVTLTRAIVAVALLLGLSGGVFASVASSSPTTKVSVSPSATQGWTFWNDQTNSQEFGVYGYGPSVPPNSVGSFQLSTNLPSDGHALINYDSAFSNLALSTITDISYDTYVSSKVTSEDNINFEFDVNVLGTSAYQGRLVYYTDVNSAPAQGVWQTQNPITNTTPSWYFSHAASLGSTCTQTSFCTWSQVLAEFPNAQINTDGSLIFKAGSGYATPFVGNVDALSITAGGNTTAWTFGPDQGPPGAPFGPQGPPSGPQGPPGAPGANS